LDFGQVYNRDPWLNFAQFYKIVRQPPPCKDTGQLLAFQIFKRKLFVILHWLTSEVLHRMARV